MDHVYVMKSNKRQVKVGISGEPLARAREVGSALKEKVILVFSMPHQDADKVERRAHLFLQQHRTRGNEWFGCSADEAIDAVMRASNEYMEPTNLRLDASLKQDKRPIGKPSVRRANKAYRDRLEKAGLKSVTVWMSPEALQALASESERRELSESETLASAIVEHSERVSQNGWPGCASQKEAINEAIIWAARDASLQKGKAK